MRTKKVTRARATFLIQLACGARLSQGSG